MKKHIAHIALVIDDYDKAIEYYTKTLNFILIEDTKLDADTMLEQIQQIPFTPTERSNFNPIIHSTFITLSKDKIENLKQSIMLNYIINCKYNSISQVNDIKYLNSENAEIKKILQNKDTPPSKIIEISQILKKNVHA